MLEPPSQDLVRRLTELQLCHPRDLRRARGRVRRLAFDLPAFDSVWIDSLVQLRLLTPYQAKQLEAGHSDELRIGSFIAIDELGRSPRGTTLLARRLQRRDRCVVKRVHVTPDRVEDVSYQMQLFLERAGGFVHPALVVPNEILPGKDDEFVTVSRFVPGLPLNDLLVRRGRFPAAIVLEIGRQLLDGLAALHKKSLVHGDIRMSNVRLTESGSAVLVEAGIRQALHPEITIHDTLPLEAYDGVASELIGTGAAPTASSELYAVGCLLWQLLAGRPPFATADPLGKLAAHQTQTIDDVRCLAPDTPASLAETICKLTASDPQLRPRSFDEVLQRWGRPTSLSRLRLRQFRRLFNGAVPHFSGPAKLESSGGWIWITAFLFAVSGVVAVLYDSGLRSEMLTLVQNAKSAVNVPLRTAMETQTPTNTNTLVGKTPERDIHRSLLTMPLPSADGVIILNEHGPYEASAVTFKGDLTIRGTIAVQPEIQVDDDYLSVEATHSVSLEHLTIRRLNGADARFLVRIRSQQLRVENCEFLGDESETEWRGTDIGVPGLASIAWAPVDNRDPQSGQIEIKNTVFHSEGTAIVFAQTPRLVTVSNTLKTGSGTFLSLAAKCAATQMKLNLDHVTLRETGPLLRLAGGLATRLGAAPTQISASHSVFKMADTNAGFIFVDSDQPRADIVKSVEMTAIVSVISPGTQLLVTLDSARDRVHLDDADDQFEGLEPSEMTFAGKKLQEKADSKTLRLKGPHTGNNELPGIDVNHLGTAGPMAE